MHVYPFSGVMMEKSITLLCRGVCVGRGMHVRERQIITSYFKDVRLNGSSMLSGFFLSVYSTRILIFFCTHLPVFKTASLDISFQIKLDCSSEGSLLVWKMC